MHRVSRSSTKPIYETPYACLECVHLPEFNGDVGMMKGASFHGIALRNWLDDACPSLTLDNSDINIFIIISKI